MIATVSPWEKITPAKVVPKSPLQQEHIIPARYHGRGYETNDPDSPLWTEVLRALRSPCRPHLFRQNSNCWCLEYSVIVEPALAARVAATLLRYRTDPLLWHFLARESGLRIPPTLSEGR